MVAPAQNAGRLRLRIGRVIGLVLASAVAWGYIGNVYLIDLPEESCCTRTHDTRKCPCRHCTHARDSSQCFFEQCNPGPAPSASLSALDVFIPSPPFRPAPVSSRPLRPESRPQLPIERPVEVPTPPA
jgi:hypothetical protein